MNRSQRNIEELLEHLGSKEVPEDTVHRYELRRELLCSKYFGDHCFGSKRWNRLLTFTMPLLTGGVLVVVFSFVGMSLSETASVTQTPQTAVIAQAVDTEEQKKETSEFIDSRTPVSMYDVIKFVPVKTVDYVLMH